MTNLAQGPEFLTSTQCDEACTGFIQKADPEEGVLFKAEMLDDYERVASLRPSFCAFELGKLSLAREEMYAVWENAARSWIELGQAAWARGVPLVRVQAMSRPLPLYGAWEAAIGYPEFVAEQSERVLQADINQVDLTRLPLGVTVTPDQHRRVVMKGDFYVCHSKVGDQVVKEALQLCYNPLGRIPAGGWHYLEGRSDADTVGYNQLMDARNALLEVAVPLAFPVKWA